MSWGTVVGGIGCFIMAVILIVALTLIVSKALSEGSAQLDELIEDNRRRQAEREGMREQRRGGERR